MSNLTPEMRDEIAQHLREGSGIRGGRVFRDMERGLTVEQIATSQRTSSDNATDYVKGVQALLSGALPTTASSALKTARIYRYLLRRELSPAIRSYVASCLRQLAATNPEIRVD